MVVANELMPRTFFFYAIIQTTYTYTQLNMAGANTAAGALTQLIARGAMDLFLTDRPESTYWRSGFTRCTAFSMESIEQPFNSTVAFGTQATLQVNRTGDLLFHMYLKVVLPGIKMSIGGNNQPFGAGQVCGACTEEEAHADESWRQKNYDGCNACEDDADGLAIDRSQKQEELDKRNWCHWANAIGQLVIESCSLRIGGQQVDRLWGEFMFCFEELSGRVGRRLLEMVGKRYTREELIIDSGEKRTLYVPLPFWFTQASGSALALASLQFHSIAIECNFRRLQDLVVVNNPNNENYKIVTCGANGSGDLDTNTLQASLLSTYVYLEDNERNRFASSNFETLIVQHQHFKQDHGGGSKTHTLNLTFNHPVIELMWFVRRDCNRKVNSWFNFSGIECRDPISTVSFSLNNQERFGGQEASYYRLVQPYQVHSCIPDAFVYCYSFALHPEDTTTPSGSCNFSRIDHAQLTMELQEGLQFESVEIHVYATSWNVARHKQGLFGVAYSN
jgi:hypothetical protein